MKNKKLPNPLSNWGVLIKSTDICPIKESLSDGKFLSDKTPKPYKVNLN